MKHFRETYTVFVGSMLASVATTAIIGHAFDVEFLYRLPRAGVGMALPTAICFLFAGIAFVLQGRK